MGDKTKLGYFLNLKLEDQYIGAVMITDAGGIPLEFKYTEPIKPTRIHQILFGKVMEKYIGEEVIKKNLFKEIKTPPAVYFVADMEMLGDDAPAKVPLVAIQKTPLPGLASIGEMQRVKDREILVQPGTSTSPLRLTFFTPEIDVQEKTLGAIRSCLDKLDILEPFARVEAALKALCQNKN
jgi:hypothetical protein